ncbi:MAG: uracil-DNA glycosylase [Acidobacteriia bacterium]|nr:uracil-DNA glycosylase [Terriglobia bacterium]
MPLNLTPDQKRALAARVNYYRELGIYDFYRRESDVARPPSPAEAAAHAPSRVPEALADHDIGVVVNTPAPSMFAPELPEKVAADPADALRIIREDLGDCTRCKLHKQGRKQIVFGVGNPRAELMFIGEGPGADEDQQGEPFVGRAGQLLNKMIEAMGLKRSDVYIANVVKCRPPGNRTPERDECETCMPFLLRQVETINPRVIVALGAVAAKNLLQMNSSMGELRSRSYDFRGSKLFVTYHPAFLLRDPRQKSEAWKDLQQVMKFMGLKVSQRTSS